jgi:hypothetical protein
MVDLRHYQQVRSLHGTHEQADDVGVNFSRWNSS